MRSVVDHFADPYLAFLEAYRCSKVGGKLLVGSAIMEKLAMLEPKTASLTIRVAEKLKRDGFLALFRAISKRFSHLRTLGRTGHHTDDHMFRLTYSNLMDLYVKTGWHIIKEHWQKHPFQYCIYACGQKRHE
jgi:hypothetical protein